MDLISVIIPIYNLEQYIERCVRSVMAQSYTNLQIILVDDGSSDGSGAVCDALAQKDSRIKVIHKPNGGVSDARNFGVKAASGQFISFVDGDDYVHPEFIATLHTLCVENKCRMAQCSFEAVTATVMRRIYPTHTSCFIPTRSCLLTFTQPSMWKRLSFAANCLTQAC